MIILLSPSKTINFKPVDASVVPSQPQFLDQSEELIDALGKLGKKLAPTLGVSEKIADENRDRLAEWAKDMPASKSCPAAWAYRGETFFGFAADSMGNKTLAFAQEHVRIVSGLYGLLRPQDAIMAYRLEMTTRLSGPWGKNLYDFWGDTLASKPVLDQKPSFILACASDAYAKAVTKHLTPDLPVVTPKFLHQGKAKMAFAKYSRGLMARWACEQRISAPEDVLKFDAEGYVYDQSSSPLEPVFNAPDSFSLKGRFTKT